MNPENLPIIIAAASGFGLGVAITTMVARRIANTTAARTAKESWAAANTYYQRKIQDLTLNKL